MSGAEASPQPVGVVWHMATADVPAAPAATLPARFGRVGLEALSELAQAMGQDDPALVRRRFEAGRW